jgi:hypothetical protein
MDLIILKKMFCNVRCRKYMTGEIPVSRKLVHEMTEAVGYNGRSQPMYQILKANECNNGRTFLLECNNPVAVRIMDLTTVHEIWQQKCRKSAR